MSHLLRTESDLTKRLSQDSSFGRQNHKQVLCPRTADVEVCGGKICVRRWAGHVGDDDGICLQTFEAADG